MRTRISLGILTCWLALAGPAIADCQCSTARLIEALETGDVNEVKCQLDNHLDQDQVIYPASNSRPIQIAVDKCQAGIVEYLLGEPPVSVLVSNKTGSVLDNAIARCGANGKVTQLIQAAVALQKAAPVKMGKAKLCAVPAPTPQPPPPANSSAPQASSSAPQVSPGTPQASASAPQASPSTPQASASTPPPNHSTAQASASTPQASHSTSLASASAPPASHTPPPRPANGPPTFKGYFEGSSFIIRATNASDRSINCTYSYAFTYSDAAVLKERAMSGDFTLTPRFEGILVQVDGSYEKPKLKGSPVFSCK